MSWFYFIGAPTCAGGFDVVGPNEGLIRAGRCPHLLFPTVYGGARAASVVHRMLSKLAGLCPRGASAWRKLLPLDLFRLSSSGEMNDPLALSHLSEAPCPLSHIFVPLVIAAHPPYELSPQLGKPGTSPGSCC